MHISMPEVRELAISALKRLKTGSCCVLCNRIGHQDIDLCTACNDWLPGRINLINPTTCSYLCVVCGAEHSSMVSKDQSNQDTQISLGSGGLQNCLKCQKTDKMFRRILAPYRYEYPLDHIIGRMKYGQRRVFGRVFGRLLASSARCLDELPDVLVPVPLHPRRQAERGYNQAGDIARWCADELNLSYRPGLVSRISDTGSLAGLSKAARQLRILGAFRASSGVNGLRIAIVDDVMTTGATARELARELYDTGALSVELWVLARTSSER